METPSYGPYNGFLTDGGTACNPAGSGPLRGDCPGQLDDEHGALAGLAFDLDAPAMAVTIRGLGVRIRPQPACRAERTNRCRRSSGDARAVVGDEDFALKRGSAAETSTMPFRLIASIAFRHKA